MKKQSQDAVQPEVKEADLKSALTEIEILKRQLAENVHRWKRALADYQNLEKRVQEERRALARYAAETIVTQLLTVYDTLEQAAKHLKDQGFSLGLKNFWSVLKEHGLERIEVLGRTFNPHEMECVEVVKVNQDKVHQVVEEIRSGYKLYDKVIRAAQVIVGDHKIDKESVLKTKEELRKDDYI